MAFKFIILSALVVAAANAGVLPLAYQAHSAPLALHTSLVADEHQYAPPHYAFSYDVHDLHTGDIKSQEEKREGDVVVGRYSLIEPDGSRRTVEYTADDHNGFNAVVHREVGHHPVAIKAPVAVHHAPTLAYQAHQPAVYSHYAAPSLAISHHEPLGYSGYSSHY